MKSAIPKILSSLGAAACLAASVFPCLASGNYGGISQKIAGAARANNIQKLAVLQFSAKGGAGPDEADYAAEKIGAFLAACGGPALIERDALEKILGQERLAYAGSGPAMTQEALSGLLSVDAVITGSVFAYGRKLIVLARLVEMRTGRVLLSAEGESERPLQPPEREARAVNLDGIPVPPEEGPEPALVSLAPEDFRDAPAAAASCAELRGELAGLNSELVAAKARYWAGRMRLPGFDLSRQSRNPGSEIGDAKVRARFYALLAMYYLGGSLPPEAPGTAARLRGLLAGESRFLERCGLRPDNEGISAGGI